MTEGSCKEIRKEIDKQVNNPTPPPDTHTKRKFSEEQQITARKTLIEQK